jgi:uncharacterized protein
MCNNILYFIFNVLCFKENDTMNGLKKFIDNNEFIKQRKEYSKIDALLTIILYLIIIIIYSLFGKLFILKNLYANVYLRFFSTGFISFLLIGSVLLLCFIRKQKLYTVGFSKFYAFRSFLLGMVLSLVLIIIYVLPSFISSTKIQIQTNTLSIIMNIIYYMIFVALPEEIIFRGYIGTRLLYLIKNKGLSIILVGILFSLEHIPFNMILAHTNIINYISVNINNLVFYILIHFILQRLYLKYNNIIAPIIFHFIWNFMQWFIIL